MESDLELLQVKYDDLFHELFNENEMQTLEWSVMKILDCSYEDIHGRVEVKNIRKPKVNDKEKNKYVDLIVNYKNETIILELNHNFRGNYTRNIMYAFNELLSTFGRDDDTYYKKIARVILVNLNWFYEGNDFDLPSKQEFILPYPNYKQQGYILKVVNVNLDCFSKLCYNQVKKSDRLYKLLTIKQKEDLNELVKDEKMLNNYSKKLINLSSDNDYKERVMDRRIEENLAKHEAYFEGVDAGVEAGILENQKQVVLNMYNKKYDLKSISEITELSIQEVENIIKNNK